MRRLSKEAGLFTHDKPAYACLATRIPVGEAITNEKLACIEATESWLKQLGLRDFRVRTQETTAKLQLRESDLDLVIQNRERIVKYFKQYYDNILLDLEVKT